MTNLICTIKQDAVEGYFQLPEANMSEETLICEVNVGGLHASATLPFLSFRRQKSPIFSFLNLLRDVMLCYVVGSRWLMSPDALQPKAYCTNPGLQSFLLAPPVVVKGGTAWARNGR